LQRVWRALSTVVVFHILALAGILFVATDTRDFIVFVHRLATETSVMRATAEWQTFWIFGGILFVCEGLQELAGDPLVLNRGRPAARWVLYVVTFSLIVLCGATGAHEFVYFQF
jgi:hypothetical protein